MSKSQERANIHIFSQDFKNQRFTIQLIMSEEDRLVYSTESKGVNLAKVAKKKGGAGDLSEVVPESTSLKLQYEKKGRGGKGVTLVMELPNNPPYFKRLMKEIKAQLAAGGAYKEEKGEGSAQLEFQGNHLDAVRVLLQEKGFSVRG